MWSTVTVTLPPSKMMRVILFFCVILFDASFHFEHPLASPIRCPFCRKKMAQPVEDDDIQHDELEEARGHGECVVDDFFEADTDIAAAPQPSLT